MFAEWNHKGCTPFYIGPYQTDISIDFFIPIAILVLPASLFLLRRRGKSLGYLCCFCLFSIYLWVFASYTVFPFPLHIHARGFQYAALHLVPALFEGDDPNFRIQSEQVYGNFLAGVPFGFALPFVAQKSSKPRRLVWISLAFAVAPELVQLMQNLLFDDFLIRTVDIDDVWLCFAGALAGYGVLRALAYVYGRIGWAGGARLPVWDHIHSVLLSMASGEGCSQQKKSLSMPGGGH